MWKVILFYSEMMEWAVNLIVLKFTANIIVKKYHT